MTHIDQTPGPESEDAPLALARVEVATAIASNSASVFLAV
jgi:hypothetical protein